MQRIPKDKMPESTMALFSEGYEFIPNRCDRYGTDIFETRLMMRKTICMRGEEAAEIFYDTDRFQRQGAAPDRLLKTLFGAPGVQSLDGEAHRHRKALFMSLMSTDRIARLTELTADEWRAYLGKWRGMKKVVLFPEAREILCRAVCAWSGVPLPEDEVTLRTNDFQAMIDAPGGFGSRYLRGVRARKRAEAWIGELVEKVRKGGLRLGEEQALRVMAEYRDSEGNLLDPRTTAVEVINILRPTVAIGRFIVFAAHALHEHPGWPERLQSDGNGDSLENFVQEVRRFYPFFPAVAAIVRESFDWKGYHFPKGRRVLLDLYGTNRDRRTWENPEVFYPERFRHWNGSPFNFIPQGGGDHYENHRCPGEWITIALMEQAVAFLTRSMEYEVPDQDLRIKLSRIPAVPESRFVIRNVRARI